MRNFEQLAAGAEGAVTVWHAQNPSVWVDQLNAGEYRQDCECL